MGKRLFDLFWALLGLALLWPLFLGVALAIRMGDGGPVFFRQLRVGRYGKPFRIWKFRTMCTGAEQKGRSITVGQDARITRIGRWLRASKVDEVPQLLNVLAGTMSFVGPRPEVPRYVELYSEAQRAVLDLRPGITDLASIRFRRESEILAEASDPDRIYTDRIMPEKIRLNLFYAARANVVRDFQIILVTLGLLSESSLERGLGLDRGPVGRP